MAAITGTMNHFSRNKVMDFVLGSAGVGAASASSFIGLWLSAIDASASGQQAGEVNAGSYKRASANNDLNTWSTAVSGEKHNLIAINFPTATANFGNVSCFGICDNITAGNMLWWGYLNTPGAVNSGSAVQIASGQLVLRMSAV